MVTIVKPHDEIPEQVDVAIFLAGTIDNGESQNWQAEYAEWLAARLEPQTEDMNCVIYNPRRDDWDKNPSKEEMEYQINWELTALENSIHIIMNILPNSKSPISLLELGLFHKKMVVVCPPEFYRYDNVRIVCDRYYIPLYATLDEIKKAQ